MLYMMPNSLGGGEDYTVAKWMQPCLVTYAKQTIALVMEGGNGLRVFCITVSSFSLSVFTVNCHDRNVGLDKCSINDQKLFFKQIWTGR